MTDRSWSLLGTVASPDRAVVDTRGLVTPGRPGGAGGWSLDWWIGADDRWHSPSREAAVRQRLVGGAPVVETRVRIPGGDAIHRAYAIHSSTGTPSGQAFVIVEVENASAVPFAIAFAVLPCNPVGIAPIRRISLEGPSSRGTGGPGHRLMVDGVPGVLFVKAPARAAATVAAGAELDEIVSSGRAGESFDEVSCSDGRAAAAVIFPLPHTAVVRLALPLGPIAPTRRWPVRRRRSVARAPGAFPSAVPSADTVASGWEAHARRGMRVSLPDPAWEAAVTTGRRWLLVAHGGSGLASWPSRPFDWLEAEAVLGALDDQGFHDESGQVLATFAERQRLDGSLMGERGTVASNGAALVALAHHVSLSGRVELAEALVGPVAKAVHWIARRARHGGGFTLQEASWSIRGLGAAQVMLASIGQPEVAADAGATAGRLSALAVAPVRDALVHAAAGPGGADLAVAGAGGNAGLSPSLTLALARAELAEGDPVALDRFAWVLSVASATGTWPGVVGPSTLEGPGCDGHDVVAGAEVLRFVRDVLIGEDGGGLALCRVWPAGWSGRGLEVHEAATTAGRLSFAIRWHGDRPALLWDLDVRAGCGPVSITAPGLDASWRTSQPRGEALLSPRRANIADAAHQPTGAAAPDAGTSFS